MNELKLFISNCGAQGILILLMFAVVSVLVTCTQSAALAAVETGDANVEDLDGEATRRRRVSSRFRPQRNFRPQRRRGGYFPRWLFGG